jgi:hypothetical protein
VVEEEEPMRAREWMPIEADGKGAYALIARVPIDQWAPAKK